MLWLDSRVLEATQEHHGLPKSSLLQNKAKRLNERRVVLVLLSQRTIRGLSVSAHARYDQMPSVSQGCNNCIRQIFP